MKTKALILVAVLALLICVPSCHSDTKRIAQNSVASTNAATKTTALSREIGSLAVKSTAGSDAITSETTAAQQDLANALITGRVGPFLDSIGPRLTTIQEHSKAIGTDQKAVKLKSDKIEKIQTAIVELQHDTAIALTGAQDRESEFTKNLRYGAWIIGVGGGIFLLWRLGVLPLVRRVLHAVGRGIPAPTAAAAKMDVESLEDDDLPSSQRERIAVLRATDPAYEAAFRKNKKKTPVKKRKKK